MEPADPPNVLLIMSDEHACDAMGCAGHPTVRTPNLDRLAAAGTRFSAACTPSPICIPARASLATGLHVFEHRCWSSAQAYTGRPQSWMHRASAAGHVVESIGKLHFRSAGDDHGFAGEHLAMYVANDGAGWPQGLLRDPLPDYRWAAEYAQDLGPGHSAYAAYDREIAACAVDWLSSPPTDRPWALFVSFVSPHYPLVSPPEFFEPYRRTAVPARVPASDSHPVLDEMRRFWSYDSCFADDARRDLATRNYWGLVSFLDHNVGLVLDALERSGQRRRTVVIYTSDHGDMLGDHGFWAKSVMYERSAGVPLILTEPSSSPGVNATPVSLIDIAPTIERCLGIAWAGRAADTGTVDPGTLDPGSASDDGAKAAPRPWQARPLQGFVAEPEPGRAVLSEYHDGGSPTAAYMVRCGTHKYVHYADGSRPQLFELSADPAEEHDLVLDPGPHGAERVRSLLAGFDRRLRAIVDPEAADRQASADKQRLLASLGDRDRVLQMAGFDHTPAPSRTTPL